MKAGYGEEHYVDGETNGWQAGYDAAKAEYYESRYEEGRLAGLAVAGDSDYNTGYKDGYDKGKSDGYSSGKEAGVKEGYSNGYNIGFIDGKNSVNCNCSGGGSSSGGSNVLISYPSWMRPSIDNNNGDNSEGKSDNSSLAYTQTSAPYSLSNTVKGAANPSAPQFKQVYWLFPILAIASFSGMMQFAYTVKKLKQMLKGGK